jgi:hypothetical protein
LVVESAAGFTHSPSRRSPSMLRVAVAEGAD